MRWPWKRELVKVNGHAYPNASLAPSDLGLAPANASPSVVLRESRRCEDWYVGPRIDRTELEGNARRCFERTRIPQRVHGHAWGFLCTSACRVVVGEEIE